MEDTKIRQQGDCPAPQALVVCWEGQGSSRPKRVVGVDDWVWKVGVVETMSGWSPCRLWRWFRTSLAGMLNGRAKTL